MFASVIIGIIILIIFIISSSIILFLYFEFLFEINKKSIIIHLSHHPLPLHCFTRFTLKSSHYENTPIQIYLKKNHHQKLKDFRQISDIFHISAQNIFFIFLLKTASARRFYRVPTIYVFEQK